MPRAWLTDAMRDAIANATIRRDRLACLPFREGRAMPRSPRRGTSRCAPTQGRAGLLRLFFTRPSTCTLDLVLDFRQFQYQLFQLRGVLRLGHTLLAQPQLFDPPIELVALRLQAGE